MLPVEVVGYVIATILAVQRSLALCVVGVVAVVRARREDIPAVVRALALHTESKVTGR
jgi:hypothetical protein